MSGIILADPGGDGQPSFTGKKFRSLLSSLMGGGGSRAFGAGSGVRPNTPTTVVTATSTAWTVGPHGGIIDTSASGTDGAMPYAFLAAETGGINAASAVADRVDLLCVQLSDPSEGDGSAAPKVDIVYQAGVAGSGIPLNLVARSFVLAQINVPRATTGSPSVTFVAPRVAAAGGIRPALDSSQYPSAPYVGQYIDDASLGLLRWNGTAWATASPGSGWHNLALDGPYNDDNGSAQYRSDGQCTYVRGRIAKDSGTAFATGTGINFALAGAIPAGLRPSRSMAYMTTSVGSADPIRVTVSSDGSLTAYVVNTGVLIFDLAGVGPWFADS